MKETAQKNRAVVMTKRQRASKKGAYVESLLLAELHECRRLAVQINDTALLQSVEDWERLILARVDGIRAQPRNLVELYPETVAALNDITGHEGTGVRKRLFGDSVLRDRIGLVNIAVQRVCEAAVETAEDAMPNEWKGCAWKSGRWRVTLRDPTPEETDCDIDIALAKLRCQRAAGASKSSPGNSGADNYRAGATGETAKE